MSNRGEADPRRPARTPALGALAALLLLLLLRPPAAFLSAAELLDGEFGDIDLGRPLIEPRRFPTIGEFRQAVRRPEIHPVLMFKLLGGRDDHHLPVFSGDGRRLALQRGDLRASSSQVLLYPSLGRAQPTPLGSDANPHDYMFRWGVNCPASYTFARIHVGGGATQICLSADGQEPVERTSGAGRHVFPALYRRTDGIWRLVYERDGQLMHESWNAEGPIDPPSGLFAATTPRWSRDGFRLLLARERFRHGDSATYDMMVRDLRTETDRLLPTGEVGIVRSPSWSPDERLAAFYVRASGRGKPWRIRVCPVDQDDPGITLGSNVVVNLDFTSEGPAWEPSSRRVWFFSNRHQQESYHPMVAADVRTGEIILIDYPRRCTTPNDLAINPATAVPEVAFVAHEGLPQDVFVVFLNHY